MYEKFGKGPVMLLLHGGGHSALSWAVFTHEIVTLCDVHVVAFDFRGHGGTHTDNDEGLGSRSCAPSFVSRSVIKVMVFDDRLNADLSYITLCNDVIAMLRVLFDGSLPHLILVGHRCVCIIHVHIAYCSARCQ